MAGNKLNTKTKNKEDKNKTNSKSIGQTNDECEETDFSLLRKPIHTSITGFGQARKIFDLATEELKDLLSNECDILYECKVCRNIFRSLANFISHKRVYCKEKFNSSIHSHFIKNASLMAEVLKIKHLEQGYQDSLKENTVNLDNEDDNRIPLTKDLTTIMEKICKTKGVNQGYSEESQVVLQTIPNTSAAVFQSFENGEKKQTDSMGKQVKELDKMLSKDTAVLQSDGNFRVQNSEPDADNVIQISDDEDDTDDKLKCKICEMQFSTQKTLKFHMKYKHVESRLVYPCPDCYEIFSTSWSVYRHLFKVHRKTAAQIRKLRESIQTKAFKMNNPPALYEKRKNNMKTVVAPKMTEEERLDQENQAWMDNLEGDGEVPRCGGCGRTFERRAALAAHTHTCTERTRARLAARRAAPAPPAPAPAPAPAPPAPPAPTTHDTKKIEIQIRKDYNKGPPVNLNLSSKPSDAYEKRVPKKEAEVVPEPIREEKPVEEEVKSIDQETPMDVSEDDNKPPDAEELPEKEKTVPNPVQSALAFRFPFAHQAEKTNLAAFRQKIQHSIDYTTLTCKKCDTQYNEIQQLYDHMADHIKWVRYACKLCNFKHYNLEKLPEHVKLVHKLKGDNDFYFSTVKPVDGTDALDLCEDEFDANETSPDSEQPSRCSSDSSRLSDDSSSSGIRVEGVARKRKLCHTKHSTKRKKEFTPKGGEDSKDSDLSERVSNFTETSNIRTFEENSSDIDDIEERLSKRQIINDDTSVASRRPVRRKTKPKNEDFEYDLSNLLKMEAQGYRDSQSMANAKSSQPKKKPQPEVQPIYENLNKDCCGALATMSKKSAMRSAAHLKTNFKNIIATKDVRSSNVFLRPLPKPIARTERGSPKKILNEDQNETCSPNKQESSKESTPSKPEEESPKNLTPTKVDDESQKGVDTNDSSSSNTSVKNLQKEQDNTNIDTDTGKKPAIPTVLPIKFRRQSLEVIKNPIINKNIKDFTKAGMKTKILVIKPINRNKDGSQAVNTPLKFQTIKLKDPNKGLSKEDKDQVVVVKVPKVECAIARQVGEVSSTISERLPSADTNKITDSLHPTNNDTNISAATEADVTKEDIPIESNTEIKDNSVNQRTKKSEQISVSELNKALESINDIKV